MTGFATAASFPGPALTYIAAIGRLLTNCCTCGVHLALTSLDGGASRMCDSRAKDCGERHYEDEQLHEWIDCDVDKYYSQASVYDQDVWCMFESGRRLCCRSMSGRKRYL